MGNAGSDLAWQLRELDGRIKHEDLQGIRTFSAGITVPLDTALDILWVILKHEPARFDSAAARWVGRLAADREVSLEDVGRALDALELAELDRPVLEELARRPRRRRRAVGVR